MNAPAADCVSSRANAIRRHGIEHRRREKDDVHREDRIAGAQTMGEASG
jgi:hypothetical protein